MRCPECHAKIIACPCCGYEVEDEITIEAIEEVYQQSQLTITRADIYEIVGAYLESALDFEGGA